MARAQAIRSLARETALLSALAVPVGALAGAASALFLAVLGMAVRTQQAHAWLLYLLPLAGVSVAWLYRRHGGEAAQGMGLLIGQARAGAGAAPRRMAPLVLVGTVVSQLCGASVGREGTAIQMGGGLAGSLARLGGSPARHPAGLVVAGMAGGFGSVFGTPLAGAIFAVEVLAIGRVGWRWLPAALVASVVADQVCLALGASHARLAVAGVAAWPGWALLAKVALAGVAFGLAARAFVGISRGMSLSLRRLAPSPELRAAVGAAALIGLVHLVDGRDYLGLGASSPDPGVVTLASAFGPGGAETWSWWWKLVFTALCVAAGFKGGEVTPLLFIGATLGHTLAGPLGARVDLLAGMGLVAVLAGAAGTPVACWMMGIELLGPALALPLAAACAAAWATSGRTGIYPARSGPA